MSGLLTIYVIDDEPVLATHITHHGTSAFTSTVTTSESGHLTTYILDGNISLTLSMENLMLRQRLGIGIVLGLRVMIARFLDRPLFILRLIRLLFTLEDSLLVRLNNNHNRKNKSRTVNPFSSKPIGSQSTVLRLPHS
jgi:hypothetical protein